MQLSFSEVSTESSMASSAPGPAKSSTTLGVSDAGVQKLRLYVLASGSKGNASIIEDAASGRAVLVDCGICKRDFFERSAEFGFDPGRIESILVTHEHTDHTKGIGVVMRGLAKQGTHPTVYASSAVYRASSELSAIEDTCDLRHFRSGDALSLAGMQIEVFLTSHDAAESFGFRIEQDFGDAIGYMTDTGVVTGEAFEALKNCRILALESNHDKRMLETGPYPYVLKKRVASDRGHLSNAQAADALETLLSGKLEHVVAMHISENNNTYRLPQDVLQEIVSRNDHPAEVCAAYQHRAISIG